MWSVAFPSVPGQTVSKRACVGPLQAAFENSTVTRLPGIGAKAHRWPRPMSLHAIVNEFISPCGLRSSIHHGKDTTLTSELNKKQEPENQKVSNSPGLGTGEAASCRRGSEGTQEPGLSPKGKKP